MQTVQLAQALPGLGKVFADHLGLIFDFQTQLAIQFKGVFEVAIFEGTLGRRANLRMGWLGGPTPCSKHYERSG
jgi:hypothetical protein